MPLRGLAITMCAGGLLFSGGALAEEDDKKSDEKKGPPSIEKKTEEFDKLDGLFPIYTDPTKGTLFLEIAADQLDEEFIAFSYTENGVLEAGFHGRGFYRDQRILSFNTYYDKIELVEVNTAFYFDETNAISRAKDANISPAVLGSFKIVAKTEDEENGDRYLINADKLFLSEALHQVKASPNPEAPPNAFSLGGLAKDRTTIDKVRNYPENTDVVVDYVFSSPYPRVGGSPAVTDARAVSIKMQHSFVAMPDDGYEPRFDDYRVGYFLNQVTDLTTREPAPYRDLINRWRLEKKDPEAELSDPVEPITWWIENTTPVEYRDTIRDAVLAWNSAFEKAGFTNAVAVKVQPDDAEWDAGDIRYNVLRWTSSPIPPFGGMGPSFSNPRTGEILGSDIMLEYTFLTNRGIYGEIFEDAPMPVMEHASHANNTSSSSHRHSCLMMNQLYASTQFGLAALQAQGAGEEELSRLAKESLYYLMLHEVGHTLGLNHNMKASILYGPDEVHDSAVTQGAPTGSVMDYPAVNVAPKGKTQGDYYMTRPGPYDDWAIEFGYRPDLDGDARAALLARSSEPGHVFGNDADDMRSPGAGIDPRVMISDMSSDPVAYGIDRIELVHNTLKDLDTQFADEDSWQKTVRTYAFLMGQQAQMGVVMSRQVGGIHIDRTAPTQLGADAVPYSPISKADQKAALKALGKYIFAADAFDAPASLYGRLQTQRRDFGFFGQTEDPKIHARVLGAQMAPLAHLLHPVVLTRMSDSALYGNEYSPADMLVDLNEEIFGNDLVTGANSFRRNLQIAYLQRLMGLIYNPESDATSRTAAMIAIKDVRKRLGSFGFFIEMTMDDENKAHRAQIKQMVAGV